MAVIETVSARLGIHPVVVGGMAVYFWTASNKFVTYDIDVVMDIPRREKPRSATETEFLRHIGTPERLIGPAA